MEEITAPLGGDAWNDDELLNALMLNSFYS
jgi:hypothetical protein